MVCNAFHMDDRICFCFFSLLFPRTHYIFHFLYAIVFSIHKNRLTWVKNQYSGSGEYQTIQTHWQMFSKCIQVHFGQNSNPSKTHQKNVPLEHRTNRSCCWFNAIHPQLNDTASAELNTTEEWRCDFESESAFDILRIDRILIYVFASATIDVKMYT